MSASSSSDQFVEKGRVRHVKGDLAGAIARYEKALTLNPDHAEALHLKGVALIQQNDPRAAVNLITKAIMLVGERGAYFSNLAVALAMLGLHEKALHYVDRAIALGYQAPETLTVRGEALLHRSELDRALIQFQALYQQFPQHQQGFNGLLDSLLALGRFTEIRDLIQNHFASHGDDDLLRLRLATAYRLMEDHEGALKALAPSGDKENPDWIVANFKSLLELDRTDEAKPLGQKLLDKKDALALHNLKLPFVREAKKRILENATALSPAAFKSNVLCFGLWGDKEKYTFNAVLNAKLTPSIYPGWVARFYCDDTVPTYVLDSLKDYGAQIVLVARDPRPHLSLLWRFIASDDPSIGYFACRDCDSVINIREKAAVDEWLASGKPFHVMRDHVEHAELIMAGMWGGRAGLLPDLSRAAVDYYEQHNTRDRWIDQDFLRELVWPAIKNHTLVHDDFYTMGGEVRTFPSHATLPLGEHVGGYKVRQWVAKAED